MTTLLYISFRFQFIAFEFQICSASNMSPGSAGKLSLVPRGHWEDAEEKRVVLLQSAVLLSPLAVQYTDTAQEVCLR